MAFKIVHQSKKHLFVKRIFLQFLQFHFGSLSPIVKTHTFLSMDLANVQKIFRPTEIPRHQAIQHWRAISMYIRSLCPHPLRALREDCESALKEIVHFRKNVVINFDITVFHCINKK